MPTYEFKCPVDGSFDMVLKFDEVTGTYPCVTCGRPADRVFTAPIVRFNCDGFHATDYGKGNKGVGTKIEQMNDAWSKEWGEKPPKPAIDVPRNSPNPH